MPAHDKPPRERLAMSLHGAHKFIAQGVPHSASGWIGHPARDANAWDELKARDQERWLAVADFVMMETTRKRINGIAGREARDAQEAA